MRLLIVVSDDVVRDAEALLRDAWGKSVRIRLEDQLRPHVARMRIRGGGDTRRPATVILRVGPDRVDVEETAASGDGWRPVFANEVAGTVFLNKVEEIATHIPNLLAKDLTKQILIVEDVGSGPSLADLLLRADRDLAERVLMEHSRLLGRIAAATRGRVDEYRELRSRFGSPGSASLLNELTTRELRGVIERIGDELGIAITADIRAELDAVDRWVADPGGWLAYTPADACPDNNVWDGERLRVFDFGFGGLRHLALDAAYSVIPFPTCWCFAPLPREISDAMLDAFLGEVDFGHGDAIDESVWREQIAYSLAAWFGGFVAMIAERELRRIKQRGPLPGRHAVVAQMETISDRIRDRLPFTGELAALMAARLRAAWGVGDVPTYPALRTS